MKACWLDLINTLKQVEPGIVTDAIADYSRDLKAEMEQLEAKIELRKRKKDESK